MTWLFELSAGLLVAAILMTPLYKLLAPAWAGSGQRNAARPWRKVAFAQAKADEA